MEVRFVSTNRNKYREVAAILEEFHLKVRWKRSKLPEPQSDDLSTVVRSKLNALPDDGSTYLVEDSGLFLEALGGFPGVYSAYVYDTIGLRGVLRLLEGRSRRAVFRTVAGVRHQGKSWRTEGAVAGQIAYGLRGRAGFGYDPIFVPTGERRTFAEMTGAEKDRRSHRGEAIRRAGARLERLANGRRGDTTGRRADKANVD